MPDRGLLAPLSPHEEVTLGAMLACTWPKIRLTAMLEQVRDHLHGSPR
jgi:hypothetical protein